MQLDYAFVGIYTQRDFEQVMWIDVYAPDAAAAVRWSSLASGVLLTRQDELLASASASFLSGGSVSTTHEIVRLELVDGTPVPSPDGARIQLTYCAGGRLTFMWEVDDGFGLIQQISSPGNPSSDPVAIDIGLGPGR